MISSLFNFQDFASKKKYCELLYKFLSQDFTEKFSEPISEPVESATILIYTIDEFTGEESYDERDIRTHFIIHDINQLRSYHYKKFLQTVHAKALYMKEQKEGLAKTYFDKINKTVITYNDAGYLDEEIKKLLIDQLEMLRDNIEGFISNPYPNITTKLLFNWNRADVLVFFNLLRTSAQIAWIEDSDLGRIIDYVCEFRDGENYIEIKNARKHLGEYKNGTRLQEDNLNRIKEVFSSNDKYGIK